MLSVGNREDARKGLGLGGLPGESEEMEENELEEGEACSIQEDDAGINPDVDLSYIDEKIHDFLGHFQKDFEGGLSAENLGAKFGGYGSFLPAYQRSPSIWSHPRSPQKVPNHNASTSPCSAPAEATPGTSAPVPQKSGTVLKVSSLAGTKKNGACMGIPISRDTSPQHDTANMCSRNNDQNVLKLRIKVGPESSLLRPNAAIYSDMGLEYSPSLSAEDSPGTSGGTSPEPLDTPGESPMTVFRIMTCFPIPGAYVLSPLPDSILQILEKERPHLKDSKLAMNRAGSETHDPLFCDSYSSRDVKLPLGKKAASVERDVKFLNARDTDYKNGTDVAIGIRKKELDVGASSAVEVICNSLGSQYQQNFRTMDNTSEKQQFPDIAKDGCISRDPNYVISKVRDPSPDFSKNEKLLPVANLDIKKDVSTNKSRYGLSDPLADFEAKSDKACDAFQSQSDVSYSRKGIIVGTDGPLEAQSNQEPALPCQSGGEMFQYKNQSPGAKEKPGNHMNSIPPMELLKDDPKSVLSVPSKEKKKYSHSKVDRHENKRNSSGLDKETNGIVGQERHKDGSNAKPVEHTGRKNDLTESAFWDKGKDSRMEYEKSTFLSSEKAKEKTDLKKVQISQLPDAVGRNTDVAPLMANGLTSDVPLVPPSQVVIEEHWVCCDRCQKWRLLPYHIDPDHLPKKWLCSMLSWLAGMNKCSVSEEVTTGTLRALYQVPPPENHAVNVPNMASAVVPDGQQNINQNHEHILDMNSSHGKKKHAQKDTSQVPSYPIHSSQSAKKSLQASVKSRSLDDVNQVAPLLSSKTSFPLVNKTNEINVKKDSDIQKEKLKLEEKNLDEGEFLEQYGKSSKHKSKRDFDQDGFRASKKVKTDGIHGGDEDWQSDPDMPGKVALINNNGLPPKMTNKYSIKVDGNSSLKNSKANSQDSLPGTRKKTKPHIQTTTNGYSTFDEERCSKESSAKKRKVKERQLGHVGPHAINGNGLLTDDRFDIKEEFSETESGKEKRSRGLKADGSYSVVNKEDAKMDKRGRVTKVLISHSREHVLDRMQEDNSNAMVDDEQKGQFKACNISERNLDSLDSMKRDLPSVNPSTAATSSSSKVSGTCKSKSNFQETRGSPVESVSSSPLRISNSDKHANKKNQVVKDEDNDFAVAHSGLLDASRSVDSRVREPAKALSDYQLGEEVQNLVGEGRGGRHVKSSSHMHDALLPGLEGNYLLSDGITHAQHKFHEEFHDRNHGHNNEKPHNFTSSSNFTQRKSNKISLQPWEKHKSSKLDVNKGKGKASDSLGEKEDMLSSKKSYRSKYDTATDAHQLSMSHEDLKNVSNRIEKKDGRKRESAGRQSSECRRDNHFGFGTQENLEAKSLLPKKHKDKRSKDSEIKTMTVNGGKSHIEDNPQSAACQGNAKLPSRFPGDRTEKSESALGRGRSQPHSHSGDKQDMPNRDHPRANLSVVKGDRMEASSADPLNGAAKVLKGKLDRQNGQHHNSMRHPTPNGADAPSPARKDSNHSAATVALKEARDLKHSANRLKSEGLENESTGLCFQAALKFLYAAFLLENSGSESGKHGETAQSMAIYSDTARLYEFCAQEYEKHKDMAAAALAYKCMEVAYMKVVFLKHASTSKDRSEFHTALHMVPTGESPSSSAPDVDNLNNQGTGEKVASTKGVSSPQIAGNHVIMAQHRPKFARLLHFVQDVCFAMDALRRSHIAFSAINAGSEELHYEPEIIASVKQILDLSFHDVVGLLPLVRLSMDAISH